MLNAKQQYNFDEAEMSSFGIEVGDVLNQVQSHLGDIQLTARRFSSANLTFDNSSVQDLVNESWTQLIARRCGAQSTAFHSFSSMNAEAIIETLEGAATVEEQATPKIASINQHAAGLDLKLHRALSNADDFHELADAIRTNIVHESERSKSTTDLNGQLKLWRQVTFVGSGLKVMGTFQGALDAAIEFNAAFGDTLTQVHAPESFLPIALMGARCLQRNGNLPSVEGSSLTALPKVVIHPRALEKLLRRFSLTAIRDYLLDNVESLNAPGLFLVDDPSIEGLWTARGFDDLGRQTGRQAFVLRGQVAERVLSSITPGQHWFPPPTEKYGNNEMPQDSFSGILVGRGDTPLQEILHESRLSLLVNDWTVSNVDGDPLAFNARLLQGVLMRGDTAVGLLRPGSIKITGHLFGERNSVLTGARLSRELQDTGSAVAPFVSSNLRINS
ncbi:MAG: metallopeptidase TldD-related protein [Bradymonadia bacterium]